MTAMLCAAAISWATAVAGTAVAQDISAADRFQVPSDPEYLVLEYGVSHDELAENDPTPLLRVYGDGTVRVHIPIYMPGAGDFTMKLQAEDLGQLLASLDARGVLGLDRDQLAQRRDQAEAARRQSQGTLIGISDTSWTHIRVRLEGYDPTGSGLPGRALEQDLRWPDVAWQAEKYPGVAELQGLAAAERDLRALLRHPDLTRVEAEED